MPLEKNLADRIAQNGPMSVAEFMELALSHPEYGYYMTRDPFGETGDFTTAPEVSQMFGEMIGIWLADTWMQMGSPERFTLLECGPGRGTLMSDILRATKHIKGFHDSVHVALMEISPVLMQAQKDTLKEYGVTWIDTLDSVSKKSPVLMVANEFLDALPIHQYYEDGGRWIERQIIMESNTLAMTGERKSIKEKSPARENFMKHIAVLLKQTSGAGLFIDYGYTQGQGDTLQAVYKHKYCSPLEHIGHADITAHVDFGVLKAIMPSNIATQGTFLKNMGIELRAQALTQKGDAQTIASALHRLTHHDEMGELFKVMGVSHDKTLNLAGF